MEFARHMLNEAAITIANASVSINPNANGIPGGDQIKKLVNGIAFYGLIGAAAAIIISAFVWAISSHSQNSHHAGKGQKGVLIGLVAAFAIGASAGAVNWFYTTGQAVK